ITAAPHEYFHHKTVCWSRCPRRGDRRPATNPFTFNMVFGVLLQRREDRRCIRRCFGARLILPRQNADRYQRRPGPGSPSYRQPDSPTYAKRIESTVSSFSLPMNRLPDVFVLPSPALTRLIFSASFADHQCVAGNRPAPQPEYNDWNLRATIKIL